MHAAARWQVRIGVVLLVSFVALAVGIKFTLLSTRFVASGDLLDELADAEFLDDPPPASLDWPRWRGSLGDGVTTMPDLSRQWKGKGPPRLWRKASGDGYSSFAVAAGRVYTTLALDDGEAVICWDLTSGVERWRHPYTPRQPFQYGGPRATPTLDGDRLYTLTADGLLMCLNSADGSVVWEKDLAKEMGASPPRWGLSASPLVEGERVFVMLGGSRQRGVAAFHKETGEVAWAALDDPAGYGSPIAATIGGTRQVIFFTGTRLVGLAPGDGALLWEYPWKTPFEVNAATPLVFRAREGDGEKTYVFVSSGYNRGCGLVKIESRGEEFQARRVYESGELCCHFSTPVRYKDHVYACDENRDLTCLNLRTGVVRWRFERTEDAEGLASVGFKSGSLIRADDVLIVLGTDGKLALVKATPEGYSELTAARPFRDRCWTMPVLAGGRLLVRDLRQVFCLDVRRSVEE